MQNEGKTVPIIRGNLYENGCAAGLPPAALMSLNMLIETEGRNYTWSEYTEWSTESGFRAVQLVPVQSPGANGLLIGHKR